MNGDAPFLVLSLFSVMIVILIVVGLASFVAFLLRRGRKCPGKQN